ncbi:response regulator [Bordetella genomosp. 13]|uniref:Response regulatory domain-containing protein n=1 Tax=Bordetella genomosp. 13 TaxID=463040 RepID=A0A1W6ZGB4_9BORD|nr:response regulator [Bordetella genomosp. 13]ARP95864.1 hypothetical protein CAL15_16655 [Bordetella genomosp. 13]
MNDIEGLRVLVVEDEAGVALLIQDMLEELGCEVAASIAHLPKAFEAADTISFDFALLDVNVHGVPVFPFAHALRERGKPVVFSTGYGREGLPSEFKGYPVLGKPFSLDALERAITDVAATLPRR